MTIDELTAENKNLQEKLDIAIQALEHYAHENSWVDCRNSYNDQIYREALFFSQGYKPAQEALAKIKGD